VFTRVPQWSLSLDESSPYRSHHISLRSILMLSYKLRLCLSSGFFPSDLPTKTMYTFLFSPCVLHDLPISSSFQLYLTKSTNYSFFLQTSVTSSLLGPNILFNTVFSNTVCILPILSGTKFHTNRKLQGKIIVLYIIMFTFLCSRREDGSL
jgi:hypothetical protein